MNIYAARDTIVFATAVPPHPLDHFWVGALTVLLVSIAVALIFARAAREVA